MKGEDKPYVYRFYGRNFMGAGRNSRLEIMEDDGMAREYERQTRSLKGDIQRSNRSSTQFNKRRSIGI